MKNRHNDIAVKLTNISKQYTIHHEKPTLVEKFYKGEEEKFWALRNINLTIKKGERVGVIGPNGSGKTTFLKTIVGITTPTEGTVVTNGKIVSLIDVEAGFHPEFSGYQNIYMNGMILGIKKHELDEKIRSIVEFADIGSFMNTQLFTYSEGMKIRLGFSIILHSNPDILIFDERISVADHAFQEKSDKRIRSLSKNKTIIFSSHYKYDINKYCRRILTFQKGQLIEDADINKCKKYYNFLL